MKQDSFLKVNFNFVSFNLRKVDRNRPHPVMSAIVWRSSQHFIKYFDFIFVEQKGIENNCRKLSLAMAYICSMFILPVLNIFVYENNIMIVLPLKLRGF